MPPQTASATSPWYRHFWPWFLLGLIGSSVAGSIATVVVAFSHRDSLVRDDWYRDGLAINRRLEADRNARLRGLRAVAEVEAATGALTLELTGEAAPELASVEIELSHPTQAHRDRSVLLGRVAAGRFRGHLPEGLQGRWYAVVKPVPRGDWRLTRVVRLPATAPIVFGDGG